MYNTNITGRPGPAARAKLHPIQGDDHEPHHPLRHPRPAAAGGAGTSEIRRRHSPRGGHQLPVGGGYARLVRAAVCGAGQRRQGLGRRPSPRPDRDTGRRAVLHGPQQKGRARGPDRGGRGGVRPLPQIQRGTAQRRAVAQPRQLRAAAVPPGDHPDAGRGLGRGHPCRKIVIPHEVP